jgi:hypothetical protein
MKDVPDQTTEHLRLAVVRDQIGINYRDDCEEIDEDKYNDLTDPYV